MLPLYLIVTLLLLATSSNQELLEESETNDEYLEDFLVYPIKPLFTRRSSDGKVELVQSITPTAKSHWCELSVLCARTLKPICAFDDNFGYGRFYDLCHMFQVNCYWKYNFSIVKNCKPSVLET
ncbi:uncharacterized protein LOC125232523 [Leguminivora glycinivorella]|uniref:uncharacterized protein LOC125232523 n=1 Tax=Leguminivora glycinivorella TaxID=1035111 RepID=UPI00200FB5B7|nr:uncharacterized protein LOC125232523 [Leguminivora glycinivorella]